MLRQPVRSSNILSIGHDPTSNTLEIEFKGGRVYQYGNVNVDEARALLRAPSIGSHFANILKPVKPARVVFEKPAP